MATVKVNIVGVGVVVGVVLVCVEKTTTNSYFHCIGMMNGVAGVAGIEIGLNLTKLGEVERAQSEWTNAFSYFERAGKIYLRLLTREYLGTTHNNKNDSDAMKLLAMEMKTAPSLFEKRLVRLCVSAWNWQLKVSLKASIDQFVIKGIEHKLVSLKNIVDSFDRGCSGCSGSSARATSTTDDDGAVPSSVSVQQQLLCEQLMRCRCLVRDMLTSKKKPGSLRIKCGEVLVAVKELTVLFVEPGKATEEMDAVGRLWHAANVPVSNIVSTLTTYIDAGAEQGEVKLVKNNLFGATDDLREVLRDIGIDVKD